MSNPRFRRRHADIDNHHIRVDRRNVRNVRRVPEQQLERVAAFRQGHGRFGLAGAEMQVVFIVRDRLIQRRQRRIDEKMVVSRVRLVHPGRSNAHLFKAEADSESGRHVRRRCPEKRYKRAPPEARDGGFLAARLARSEPAQAAFPPPSRESCRNRPAECGGCDPRRRAAVASVCGPGDSESSVFRLAAAEVEMVLIVRNRLVERRQIRVDQQMVMTGVGPLRSGRRDAHPMQAEMNRGLRADDRAVLEVDEFNLGAGRGWGRSSLGRGLRKGGGGEEKAR